MIEDDTPTYRDGVGMERCRLCQRALRTKDNEPLVSVRISDLETVLRVLCGAFASTRDTDQVMGRIAQAVGLSMAQAKARHDGL